MNLFLSTRRLTSQAEDHLTEFLAVALAHAPGFAAAYARFVLGDFASRQGWPEPVIERVETQVDFAEHGCRPDLVLRLRGGKTVLCEHKLDAPETFSEDDRGQLLRYLELPGVDGVAYVRVGLRSPEQDVLNHPRYIRPAERHHFLWYDIYPLMQAEEHLLVDWLRSGFEDMNLTPPSDVWREPTLRPQGEEEFRAMVDFAKYWDRVRSHAANNGWKPEPGCQGVEVYLEKHPSSSVGRLFITPKHGDIRVQFTPRAGQDVGAIESLIDPVLSRLPPATQIERDVANWKGQPVEIVRVKVPRSDVIGTDGPGAEVIQDRLLAFVGPLVKAVSGNLGRDPFPKPIGPTVRKRGGSTPLG
jgi:hypothetical protein